MASAGCPTRIIDTPAPLVSLLITEGFRVVAPVERDGAVVTAEIARAADLPRGRIDDQKTSHSPAAADASDSVRSWLRPAAARAAQTSGYASRLDNAASQAFQTVATTSDPVSSSTSLTSALESK